MSRNFEIRLTGVGEPCLDCDRKTADIDMLKEKLRQYRSWVAFVWNEILDGVPCRLSANGDQPDCLSENRPIPCAICQAVRDLPEPKLGRYDRGTSNVE